MTERTIISKMTFYDIVTLIVPSAILCCCNGWLPFQEEPSWIGYVALLGVVLMIGLILKGISIAWNTIWFRNSTKMIFDAENDTNVFINIVCAFVCGPLAYVLSFVTIFVDKKDEGLLKRYYDQYEKAYNNKYSGKRIELLEAQVAFLQSMIWALVFCFAGIFLHDPLHCPIVKVCLCPFEWWVILILIYACIVTMIILQKKVYKVVFESKGIENNNNNQTTIMKFWDYLSEHSAEAFLIIIVVLAILSMPFAFLSKRPANNCDCHVTVDSTQTINVKLVNDNSTYDDVQ